MNNNSVNELYHHGIKGMKWGVRRTPEQLGYKVSEVKRKPKTEKERKAAAKAAIKKAMAKKKSDLKIAEMKRKGQEKIDRMAAKEIAKQQKKIDKKNEKEYKKQQNKINRQNAKIRKQERKHLVKQQQKDLKKKEKRLNDPMARLTNDELKEKYERLMLEKNLYDVNSQLQKYKPKKESMAKRIVKSTFNDVVIPATKVAGKQLFQDWISKTGREKLGLTGSKDPYDDLKKKISNLELIQKQYKLEDFFSLREEKQRKNNAKKQEENRKEAINNAKTKAKNNPYSTIRFNEDFTEAQSPHIYEVPYREVKDTYSDYGRTVMNRLLLP